MNTEKIIKESNHDFIELSFFFYTTPGHGNMIRIVELFISVVVFKIKENDKDGGNNYNLVKWLDNFVSVKLIIKIYITFYVTYAVLFLVSLKF